MKGFSPAAFINANGGYVVVIKADRGGRFTIKGLPSGTYGLTYTTEGANGETLPDVDLTGPSEALTAEIPAMGLITVYAKRPPTTQQTSSARLSGGDGPEGIGGESAMKPFIKVAILLR